MNSLEDLKDFSQNFFLMSGLCVRGDSYYYENKFKIIKCRRFNPFMGKEVDYLKLSGDNIVISEVHRSNGTEANTSIYVCVMNWKDNSSSILYKEKISFKSGNASIKRQLNKVLDFYKNM